MTASEHPAPARHSVPVRVGHVTIGGSAPVVVQSMTNTDTADVEATVAQVRELAHAGSEIVRITVNSEDAARAVPDIVRRLEQAGLHHRVLCDEDVARATRLPPGGTPASRRARMIREFAGSDIKIGWRTASNGMHVA